MALDEPTKATIEQFLSEVQQLSVSDFAMIDKHLVTHIQAVRSTDPLIKLGAADFAWVDKKTRDAVRSRLPEVREHGGSMLAAGAVFNALTAAQAIVQRGKLSAEQYEALVGGYRQAGVRVPEHGSAE